MEFRILGPLQVIDDVGAEVPIGGGRERTLLVLLLLSANQVVSSSRLVEALWGDRPPDDPAHALRVHVSRLRRALREAGCDGVLVTRSPGYVVAVDAEAVDVGRFEALVAEARRCAGRGDHAAATATLRAALALWRGPSLVDIGDTSFVRAEAVRLEELRLAAIEERVEADLACGRHAEITAELDSLTRSHPLRERLWGLRMLALYRAGRPADAVRAYQELRTVLGDELGLEPSPALARLEGDILRHDPALDWSLLSTEAATRSTKYARVDGVNIAYQVVGEGPIDIVVVPGFVSNVDVYWDNPGWTKIFDRLTQLGRLVLWDKRGTGLSDPVSRVPTLDERVDDLLAVMDAAGCERPVLLGVSEGGPMALLFAATHPDRVRSVILYGVSPRFSAAPDWPHGFSAAEQAHLRRELEQQWGSGALLGIFAPTQAGNDTARQAWGRTQRAGASPTMGLAVWDAMMATDCRDILPAVRVPTLVLHRRGDQVARIQGARHIAARVPGARLVESAGENHLLPVGDFSQLLEEIARFVGDAGVGPVTDRVLITVVCVDLAAAGEAVDGAGHRAPLHPSVEDFGGREVTASGVAFVAAFAAPSRAIAWASAVRRSLADRRGVGIGVHTGECDVSVDEVRGLAVDIAARAAALAAPGEVLVTGTVKDLVAGSGLVFADRGVHQLPEVLGECSLFAVARAPERAGAGPRPSGAPR
jgi:DNA-binding SARP family transcriptional activator/pimeloyl-ACP methyl ester carboxylesterase